MDVNAQRLWELIENYAVARSDLVLMHEIGYGSAVSRAEQAYAETRDAVRDALGLPHVEL